MPGAANAMMRSAAAPGGAVAAPRSIQLDGINQWVDPGWVSFADGVEGTIGIVSKADGPVSPQLSRLAVAGRQFSGPGYIGGSPSTIMAYGWYDAVNDGRARLTSGSYYGAWDNFSFSQPAGMGTLYRNGAFLVAAVATGGKDPDNDIWVFRRGDAAAYLKGWVRCWFRANVALDAAQQAALHALIFAGDDAGAVTYLLGLDAGAEYHAVTEASNLTSGTAGGIADLTGNSVGSTPWNTTTVGNLSTDVP